MHGQAQMELRSKQIKFRKFREKRQKFEVELNSSFATVEEKAHQEGINYRNKILNKRIWERAKEIAGMKEKRRE